MSKIQFKRGLEANRTGQSPAFVPDAGEPIWATDTNKLYVGDGSTEGGVEISDAATFVASGTLASGETVALRADGTVEPIDLSPYTVNSTTTVNAATTTHQNSFFDTTTNKVVYLYDNGSSAFAVIGTVSGNSISFGTPVAYATSVNSSTFARPQITYDSSSNKIVVVNSTSTGNLEARVGTISGTSISFGSPNLGIGSSNHFAITFDSSSNKVVITFVETSDVKAIVGTVSGTSISFGSITSFGASVGYQYLNAVFDSSNNKVVIFYESLFNGFGYANVLTISGTSASFATHVAFSTSVARISSALFDPVQNKVVVAYSDALGTVARVGTVSGTSISFGSPVSFTDVVNSGRWASWAFDTTANKPVLLFVDSNNTGPVKITTGTISGTSISFSNTKEISSLVERVSLCYDPAANRYIASYLPFVSGANFYPTVSVVENAQSTNSSNFIGITAEAIADTESGRVDVFGQINDQQTGLTTGADYYVNDDGTIGTTETEVFAGKALSSTELLLNTNAGPTATATRTVTEFTATASQTDFTGLSYEVGYVDVHYNGSQLESTEFTATNGTSVTLTTPATAGAVVRVTAWKLVEFLSSGITTEEFTMTGGETSITTNYDVGAIRFLRSGTLQASADFTATNGTSISFSPAAFAGELITVEKLNQITDSLGSADIGVTVQGYDADTAKYDDVTANFTGTLQNGGSNVVVDSDIGTSVQAYNSDLTTFLGSFDLGYRNVPAVGTQTGSYSLATSDVGKYVQIGTGGSVTIPDATFSEGDVVSIFNNTASNATITCSITTAYIGGTDADVASVTLATRGIATVFFISGTVCVITGNVS